MKDKDKKNRRKDREQENRTEKNELSEVPPGGLFDLNKVVLNKRNQRLLDEALKNCGGSAAWQRRKKTETRDLLALGQISPCMEVDFIDLREKIRVLVMMKVPVPLTPGEKGNLRVANFALLGIMYPEEAIRESLPGFAYVELLQPEQVWHANVNSDPPRLVCLGDRLPVGIPLKEIVLLTYGALSMQTVQIDEADPSGVMNVHAARWWQSNLHLTPLTRKSFLDRAQIHNV